MSKPWSAERELRLSLIARMSFWTAFGIFIGAIIGMTLSRKPTLIAWNLLAMVLPVCINAWARYQLADMAPNRPHFGEQGLTHWQIWEPFVESMVCRCNLRLYFANATFHANKIDPGGGRYSLICGCGQGHYKFRTGPPPVVYPAPVAEKSDEQILSAVGAWMLCCAVGAYNGTISTSGNLDFETWFWCVRWKGMEDIPKRQLHDVLLNYAKANAHRSYREVFEAEQTLHPDHD